MAATDVRFETRGGASRPAGPRRGRRLRARASVAAWLVTAALAPAGCRQVPESVSNASRDRPGMGPWIVALPNTVTAGPQGGKTVITWDACEGNPGEVYLSVDGGPEKPFPTGGPYYADAVVRRGHLYDFRLYPAGLHDKPLASARVTTRR